MTEKQTRISADIPPERHPFHLAGGRVGLLMLHGFMGSPNSLRPLADYLAVQGYTIHAPLLPGHGHLPARLHRVTHRQWLASAQNGYDELATVCDEIFIIAHSMGAICGGYLAMRQKKVRGLVAIAPLYVVPRRSIRWMRLLRYLLPFLHPLKWKLLPRETVFERIRDFAPDLDLDHPLVQAQLHEWSKLPTSALAELHKMTMLNRPIWPRVRVPLFVLHGEADDVALPQYAPVLLRRAKSADKMLELIPNGGHEILRLHDRDHTLVWEKIGRWLIAHQLQQN